MKRSLKVLTACILLAPAFAAAAPKVYHGSIVNSDAAYPFVVSIYPREGSRSDCTGSVIADYWVLTAQHCVLDYSSDGDEEKSEAKLVKPEDIQIGTGHLAALKTAAKKVINVKNIYLFNDRIDMSLNRDVALLELAEPAGVTPVTLPESYDVFPDIRSGKQPATAVGYGFTELSFSAECEQFPNDEEKCQMTDAKYDDYLHEGKEILQSDQAITAGLKKIYEVMPREDDAIEFNPATMIGTTAIDSNVITNGDSGGPLLISVKTATNETKLIQIGVVSWGAPTPGSYTAFKLIKNGVDIYAYLADPVTLEFIKSTMKKHQ